MLIIDTDDFLLRINLLGSRVEELRGPYFEWLDVQINIECQGIQAEGLWSVMPSELRQFQEQLQLMSTAPQTNLNAELVGAETGFRFKLRMLDRGVIVGDWTFQPSPPDGAYVSGQSGFDQSFLPNVLQGIETLLAEFSKGS
jgi:hypothetical protein